MLSLINTYKIQIILIKVKLSRKDSNLHTVQGGLQSINSASSCQLEYETVYGSLAE